MAEGNQQKLEALQLKLNLLLNKQEDFNKDIAWLKYELSLLKKEIQLEEISVKAPVPVENKQELTTSPISSEEKSTEKPSEVETLKPPITNLPKKPKSKSDLEKFIGENLINKIGIVILVLGVGIGAKYAIDNELISPLTRIILGYAMGLGLIFFALKLKSKYLNFSSVLLSGSMAIMYFITFIAYDFYALLSQSIAFALMVIFTIFTVIAALNYNKQVIAHIGLIGAYAVPFLLSDGSGNAHILFGYMAFINLGILAICIKKYWKPILYHSFGLTWLIYSAWFVTDYNYEDYFAPAFIFLTVFFLIFYVATLAYKIIQHQKFLVTDISLISANAFIYFGFGYAILSGFELGENLLGLFAALNGVLHFLVCVFLYRKKSVEKTIFYFIAALVITFITIAIPIQLDGNWVTLIWSLEALLMFYLGKYKQNFMFEKMAYPLILLAIISLLEDWESAYASISENFSPILNANFFTSLFVLICLGAILFVFQKKKEVTHSYNYLAKYAVSALFLGIAYFIFRLELGSYFLMNYQASQIEVASTESTIPLYHFNYEILNFRTLWIINYSLLFFSIVTYFVTKKIQHKTILSCFLGLNLFVLLIFLLSGLWNLSELRDSYLQQNLNEFYDRGIYYILIRYISFLFVIPLVYLTYKLIQKKFNQKIMIFAELLFHLLLVWVLTSELIQWLDIAGVSSLYKIGLSILWGTYSLLLIGVGIGKKKKHLRIGAIVLFSITLIKLFFYDIRSLDTLSKTIVFVALGILLLLISFLYNKYKDLITDAEKNDN